MVKGNHQIQKNHFRKVSWVDHVKTWFQQPAKKVARRVARASKAKAVYPRPVNALRPVVRCQTIKYNTRVRAGRGYTLAELKAAGVAPKKAAGLGIAVDFRRKNKSEESLDLNAKRLKAYLAKVVVVDKAAKDVVQVTAKAVFPARVSSKTEKARALSAEEATGVPRVANMLRQALTNQKYFGRRVRKFENAAAAKAAQLKKAAKNQD